MDTSLNIAVDRLDQAQKNLIKQYLNEKIKQVVEIDDTDIIAE